MVRIPVTLSELEGRSCCYVWQNVSCIPSASAELLVECIGNRETYSTRVWKVDIISVRTADINRIPV